MSWKFPPQRETESKSVRETCISCEEGQRKVRHINKQSKQTQCMKKEEPNDNIWQAETDRAIQPGLKSHEIKLGKQTAREIKTKFEFSFE